MDERIVLHLSGDESSNRPFECNRALKRPAANFRTGLLAGLTESGGSLSDVPRPARLRTLTFGRTIWLNLLVPTIAENVVAVRERIAGAAQRAGRHAGDVMLLAIAKTFPPETVREAYDAGLRHFGENRVQEARAKIPQLPGDIHWHLVGHLQSNKARDAVELFEMIHSVDSLKLASELEKWADRASKRVPVLLEVNVAGESSKFGLKPAQAVETAKQLADFRRLELQGLMTVPPFLKEIESVRPFCRKLREVKMDIERAIGQPLPHLSMGMSHDFEIAIEEGATIVRVGTAIFGERKSTVRPAAGGDDNL
jgi:pyridoxal phosphate enzyme (YggS family)